MLVVGISLGLNNWWSFSDSGHNNDVIETCSSTDTGACGTFCDHNSTLTLVTVNDDFYSARYSTSGYCTAELTQSCAYDY